MKRLLASSDQGEEGSAASLPSLVYSLLHFHLHPRHSQQGCVRARIPEFEATNARRQYTSVRNVG